MSVGLLPDVVIASSGCNLGCGWVVDEYLD
jgi:hypothetical protein